MAKKFKCPSHWTPQERLEHYSIPDPASGCVICWAAPNGGYPHFNYKGRRTRAARMAWEAYRGPIPEGLHVLHRCDFPPCVNPDHLFLGTHAENMADKGNKGRQARGTLHGAAILTGDQVADILAATSAKGRTLAGKYNVTEQSICDIRKNRTWRHIQRG